MRNHADRHAWRTNLWAMCFLLLAFIVVGASFGNRIKALEKRVSHFEQITQDWAAEQVRIVGKKR